MGHLVVGQDACVGRFKKNGDRPFQGQSKRGTPPLLNQSTGFSNGSFLLLNRTSIPYTKIIIPARESSQGKIIYSPILETFLYSGGQQTHFSFRSVVDSGADFCVFPANFGALMGLSIKKGKQVPSFGVGGQETLYFHDIKVGVVIGDQIWKFSCQAGFSLKMNPKGTGLLGRKGFFDLFEEVVFDQNKRRFQLLGEGSRLFEEEFE